MKISELSKPNSVFVKIVQSLTSHSYVAIPVDTLSNCPFAILSAIAVHASDPPSPPTTLPGFRTGPEDLPEPQTMLTIHRFSDRQTPPIFHAKAFQPYAINKAAPYPEVRHPRQSQC